MCASAIDPMTGSGYYWGGGESTCGPDDLQPCNVSITSAAPTVTGGFCAASGGQATIPAAQWDGFVRACYGAVVTGKGCAINQTCMPKPPAPFLGGLCIRKAGNVNCPAGNFNTKHVYYEDFSDSRMCTSCSCGAPSGASCGGNITTHADSVFNQCVNQVTTFAAGTCTNLAGNPAAGNSKFTVTTPPNGGSCVPNGGTAIGSAVGTFPQTFCCAGF